MSIPKEPSVSRVDVVRHREALLAAAADELARNPEASMADVAQAAELTRATLYRHFSSRQSLLKAIQGEALSRASAILLECRLDEGSALEVLRRVIDSLSKYGMRFRIILMRGPETNAHFSTQRDLVFAPLLDVVRRGQREGDIQQDLSPEWVVSAMSSLLMTAVRSLPVIEKSEIAMAELVYKTLVGGIASRDAR
ncbi:TetR family transcriptional regulator [Alpinimonas psychrophila]|uniref:AcrR family transcriptional regulator n=1 Tax=Alpinimonas psychrophila TaxID=748908 RepID=A0A7W3PNA5_9MICO|nr:TetR/AcrR family transcriptional regulator [Alpinimonas psychrophila]MBA8828649.1 AcrR family transcriptional regulator [Alpinimonas psychrophila]